MGLSWGTPLYILALYGLVVYSNRPKVGSTKTPSSDIRISKISKDDFGNERILGKSSIQVKAGFRWSPLESVGVTLFIYFAGQLIGGLLAYSIPALFGWNQQQIVSWLSDNAFGQFVGVVFIEAISVALLLWFLKRRKSTLATIGLGRGPRFKDVGYAFLALVGYFVTYIVISNAIKVLLPALNLEQEQQIGFNDVSNLQLPLVFISLVLLPPLVEEIMTRGFLYTGLKKGLPHIPAVLITSGLFAMAHLQAGSGQPLLWVAAIDTFVLSLFLVYLRDKTGSLWASIGLHAFKNGIAFLSIFVLHIVK